MQYKRSVYDKLKTLLFGKDLRITTGDVFPTVYDYDYSSYYPEDDYINDMLLPTDNVFDIRDYGADVALDDNADCINRAVADASAVGGTVLVDGGEYVTTTVRLLSGVTLFVVRSSALVANKTGRGYDNGAVLFAENATNITITGGGKVCGNGAYFGRKPLLDANMTTHPECIDVIQMRRDARAQIRFAHENKYGGAIYFRDCTDVRAHNFIIHDSAHWSFRIENCNGVSISDFVINNNRHVANADGFDIAGTSNITIDHCFVSTADDGICVKNAIWLGNRGSSENITVRNCEVISCANSFKIGTETTYDIRNVLVEDCSFLMTDLFPGTVSGIAIESADGSVVENITVRNIKMTRVTCPVFIRLCNRNRAKEVDSDSANAVEFGRKKKRASSAARDVFDRKGAVRNIRISDITATGVEMPIMVAGYRQRLTTKCVTDVSINGLDMTYAPYPEVYDHRAFIPEYSTTYPECWRFRNLPAYGVWTRHVRGFSLTDFHCKPAPSTWKREQINIDTK